MTAAPSIPPVLNPGLADTKWARAYRRHLVRVAPELVQHAAQLSYDRTLRLCMAVLRELRECRRDTASMIEAEAVALTDWEAIAESRGGR